LGEAAEDEDIACREWQDKLENAENKIAYMVR
jgi:hypothetical protein